MISKVKVSIFCTSKKVENDLTNLTSIQIVKKGEETSRSNTVRYKVVVFFAENKKMTLLQTRNSSQAKLLVIISFFYLLQ